MPNNKKAKLSKLRGIAVGILCVFAVALVILAIGANRSLHKQQTISAEFYYMNQDHSGMQSEVKKIPQADKKEILAAVLKELKAGSKNEGVLASIPKDVEFLDVSLDGGVVTLDLSSNYWLMSAGEEMVCRASIVWTLTSLDFVDFVSITIGGKPFTKTDGTPIGNMNRNNVVIDTVVSPETKRFECFQLYFANVEENALVPEVREMEVSQNQPKERSIVEQLIAGPAESSNLPTIPADTKVRDITTTDDGICYVNFSSEFASKKNDTGVNDTLTIYSVVNSLTSLSYIEKVQFLIEGEKLEHYKDGIDISKPLAARPSLVKE